MRLFSLVVFVSNTNYHNRTGCNYDLNQASIAGIHKIELNGLSELLEPAAGSGLTNRALQHVKQALETDLADKRAVFLILSAILKINCKQTRTEVYKILANLIDTPEDLFEFVFYHKKVFPKRPGGMGSGMRKLLKNWYLKQDPFDLALEVSRVRSRHNWSHADIIKLCRVSSKDAGLDVVLASLVRVRQSLNSEFSYSSLKIYREPRKLKRSTKTIWRPSLSWST